LEKSTMMMMMMMMMMVVVVVVRITVAWDKCKVLMKNHILNIET
jgi:hypothetical protein